MNFTASSNNIVKNYYEDTPDGEQRVDKARGIWDGLWDFGDPNRHFQSLNLTYKLPFNYLPYLSFIDANFSYTGDFSWQRGSDILAEVQNDVGDVLGIVNTVQNVNSKAINGSISTSRLYQILGLKNKRKGVQRLPQRQQPLDTAKAKKPKKKRKALIQVVNVLNTLKRLQFSYTENNGQVLPGYLPKVGLVGTLQPTAAFTFGSQADVRYEAAKQGWLTDFPNFNQPFTQVHNSQLNLTGQLDFGKGLLIDLNAERNFSESITENFNVVNQEYVPLNTNVFGNFGTSTLLIKTAFRRSRGQASPYFDAFRVNRLTIAERLALERGGSIGERDEEGYPLGYGKTNSKLWFLHF